MENSKKDIPHQRKWDMETQIQPATLPTVQRKIYIKILKAPETKFDWSCSEDGGRLTTKKTTRQ